MHTQHKINQFFADLDRLQLKHHGAELAKRTGYTRGTISVYLKERKPSQAFIDKFYEKFEKDLANVPHETQGQTIAYDAPFSVLISEVAALRSHISGEHQSVVERRLRKAAEDVAKQLS